MCVIEPLFSTSSVSLLALTNPQNENQEEQLAKGEEEEEEEEVDHDDVKTPTSPMLKETENAAEDFDFHRP